MKSGLSGIRNNVEQAKLDGKVQNLASYINEQSLLESHKKLNSKKAVGIEGVSKTDVD